MIEVHANVCGGKHVLALPIGGLEDVCRIEPSPRKLWTLFSSGEYTKADLFAVLEAGIKHGKAKCTPAEIYEQEGVGKCEELALELLLKMFNGPRGAPDEGEMTPPPAKKA